MTDYITLMGSEQVSRAGNTIYEAADKMLLAANIMQENTDRLIRAMEETLERLERLSTK